MIVENVTFKNDIACYLTNINYCFDYGKIYGLLGNVSVHVFLRVLCCLLPVSAGNISVNMEDISFFLNDMKFINDFSVWEILEDISLKKINKNYLNDLLIKVDLLKASNLKVSRLTKSERKKLGIICTLLRGNKIIIIEDCFQDLTGTDIDIIRELFWNLKSQGYLIILSGRNKEEFQDFTDITLEIVKDGCHEIL